jgi:type II secretion system protein I
MIGESRVGAAFTLVEVLAAMAFMAILVPVILAAMHTSTRASESAERSAIALQLGENELNELLLNDDWSSGQSSGDFGADYPGYRWQLSNSTWSEDSNMTELDMLVFYQIQGQERQLQLNSLVLLPGSPGSPTSATASTGSSSTGSSSTGSTGTSTGSTSSSATKK